MSSAPSTCRSESTAFETPTCFPKSDIQSWIAWYQTARGKPNDVLKVDENAPVPKPSAGEVLIKSEFQAIPSTPQAFPADDLDDDSPFCRSEPGRVQVDGLDRLARLQAPLYSRVGLFRYCRRWQRDRVSGWTRWVGRLCGNLHW